MNPRAIFELTITDLESVCRAISNIIEKESLTLEEVRELRRVVSTANCRLLAIDRWMSGVPDPNEK